MFEKSPAAWIEDGSNPEWDDVVIENTLLQYVRDIAAFPLLNASMERLLGRKIVEGQRLAHVEELCAAGRDGCVRPVAVASAILVHINEALPSVRLLCANLGLPDEAPSSDLLYHPEVQELIHGPVAPEHRIPMAQGCGKDAEDLAETLSNLSLDCSLIPQDVVRPVIDHLWARRTKRPRANQAVLDLVLPYEGDIEYHFQNVRKEAGKARDELIVANLRLVIGRARRYANRGVPLTLMDLVQEGNVGLMRAVEKFDYRKGHKFSTYATLWIIQAMGNAVRKHGPHIPLSGYAAEKSRQIRNLKVRLSHEYGREPTIQEIATALGTTPQEIDRIIEVTERRTVSLYSPVSHTADAACLADYIEHPGEATTDLACKMLLQEQAQEALGSLSERERQVLQLRFGLYDDCERTLNEVGAVLNLTGERVRVIQVNALRQLRASADSHWLREY